MKKFVYRTDLALEIDENLINQKGVKIKEKTDEKLKLKVTDIIIADKNIGYKNGHYITIEKIDLSLNEKNQEALIDFVAKEIRAFVKPFINKNNPTILIVGLGNRQATVDSIGPLVTDYIALISNGKKSKKSQYDYNCIAPGVLAQTGIETSVIINGIAKVTKPDLIIAIDALAARSSYRLNSTIQLSDQGIVPGSGVGNHTHAINKKNIGIPVVALGVPTVIEASTMVMESLNKLDFNIKKSDIKKLDALNMYITPKDVDVVVKNMSMLIAKAMIRL